MSRASSIVRIGVVALALASAACTKDAPTPTPSSPIVGPSASTTKHLKPIPCQDGQLSAVEGDFKSHTNSASGVFIFTNTSTSQPCFMQGYPEFKMLDENGQPMTTIVNQGSSKQVPSIPQHKVTLKPSGGASFVFGYSTKPKGPQQCPTSAKVQIVPPGMNKAVVVTFAMNPCGGKVTISPVRTSTTLPAA